MSLRYIRSKCFGIGCYEWHEAFREAVGAIDLDLLIDQLDLGAWLPEWLEVDQQYEEEDVDSLDWREIALRGICICAKDAKRILISEYGLEESDFKDEV